MRDLRYQVSEPLLQPIQSSQLEDEAYIRLRDAIITLQLAPGAVLMPSRLAAQLGISKTPLRHALIRLEHEGFVETIAFKGTFVRDVTVRDMEDLFELREALERAAVRLAIARAGEENLARLQGIVEEADLLLKAGDSEAILPLIQRFHLACVEAAHSPRLAASFHDVDAQMERLRYIAGHIPGRVAVSLREHRAILEAVQARDERRAEEAVHSHLCSLLDAYRAAAQGRDTGPRAGENGHGRSIREGT